MIKIKERAIRNMSYEARLKNYEKEKDELFRKIWEQHLSTAEIAQAHRDLAKKWNV